MKAILRFPRLVRSFLPVVGIWLFAAAPVAAFAADDNSAVGITLIGLPNSFLSLSCGQLVPAPPVVTATSSCNPVTVTFSEVVSNQTCPSKFQLTRTWTATDQCNNVTTFVQQIYVNDNIAPTLLPFMPANINVSCASAVPAPPTVTATDNCGSGIPVFFQTQTIPGNCSGSFIIKRTWTTSDLCNNSSSMVQTITVHDNIPPTVTCKPATISLGPGGTATLAPAAVFQSGSDNCGTVSPVSVSPNTFSCANAGQNLVTLTVTDGNCNTATCTATVTVSDGTTVPTCNDLVNVSLDQNCSATIDPDQILEGGPYFCYTNYSVTLTLPGGAVIPNATVNGSHIGTTITATVTHLPSGISCWGELTVEDKLSPTVACKPATVILNASGTGTLAPSDVFLSGFDNCGAVNLQSVSPSTFTCAHLLSPATAMLTVNDGHGNTATCPATITVVDNQPPIAVCKNLTVNPDPIGNYFILPQDIDGGSSDNCTMLLEISEQNIPCKHDSYEQTLTLTATGLNGAFSTCTATVRFAGDSDCDGVGNFCDVCPGANDQLDANNDGQPDCKVFPGIGNIPASWRCGNNNDKVLVTLTNGSTICVAANAVQALLNNGNGAYVGPANQANCSAYPPKLGVAHDPLTATTPGTEVEFERLQKNAQPDNQQSSEEELTIYPNPANGTEVFLLLEKMIGKAVDLKISNLMGQSIESRRIDALPDSPITWSIDGLPNGTYLLSAKADGLPQMSRLLVVQK